MTAQQQAAIQKQVGQVQADVSSGTWNMLRQFGATNSILGANQNLGTVASGVAPAQTVMPLQSAINSGAINSTTGTA